MCKAVRCFDVAFAALNDGEARNPGADDTGTGTRAVACADLVQYTT